MFYENFAKNLKVVGKLLSEKMDDDETWVEQYIDFLQIDQKKINKLECKDFNL